jgi:hypothetical protein
MNNKHSTISYQLTHTRAVFTEFTEARYWIHPGKQQPTKDYVRNYKLFMQNEPNFRKSQMNVNLYITRDYENKHNWTLGENEPNSNPIQTQSNPIKPNSNPIQTQNKPKANLPLRGPADYATAKKPAPIKKA